jgi:capsular polysaccharide transport system permease protein
MSSTYIHTEKSSTALKVLGGGASLAYWVCVAGVLAYLWTFTWDQFTSVGTFRVSREEGSGVDAGLSQLVLPGLSDSTASDAQLAIGYINSSDLLLELEEEFGLRKHFSQPTRDVVFRLEEDAPLEDRLKFYRKQITTHFTPETGQTILNVRTFDKQLSRKIAVAILARAEKFVNEVNQDVAEQQLGFIRKEVQRAVAHVNDVNEEIIALQNKHGFIDPDQAISAAMVSVNALQSQKINKEVELTTLLRDSPESPKIPNLRSEIRSTQELMDMEMAKLSGTEQDRLNQILIEFRTLQQKLALATQLRTSAEVLLEKKRIEGIANSRFFSIVQNPYLPEEQAFPRRGYATSAILVLGLLGYQILRAIIRSLFDRT